MNYTQATSKLKAIQNLPANWDSYGAKAPDILCVARGRFLLGAMQCEEVSEVTPLANGGIQIAWSGPLTTKVTVEPSAGTIQIRPAVLWFAEQMEAKLRENDHKGGWDACDIRYLRDRLREECVELEMSLDASTNANSIREAADVGNFAMMIADSCRPTNTNPASVTVTGCQCGKCESLDLATDRASAVEPVDRHATVAESSLPDRDKLGAMVRQVWVAWAREQPNPKPSWLIEWYCLNESDKEVDRRIGERLFSEGLKAAASSSVDNAWTWKNCRSVSFNADLIDPSGLPNPKPRDESQDMWVFEDGGDCLGVSQFSHYIEQHAEDGGWGSEGYHYVLHDDLLAVEQQLAERIEIVDCPADLRDLDALWLAQTESGWKLFAEEPGYANMGYVSESRYSLAVVKRQELERVTKERDEAREELRQHSLRASKEYTRVLRERDEVVEALKNLIKADSERDCTVASSDTAVAARKDAEMLLARIDSRRTGG